MTKTYHTLKDIISSKFKSSKENDEKIEETGLNNVTEEMRKSGRSHDKVGEGVEQKKTAGEQGIYGKPRTDTVSIQQHQYNQHIIQQHILAQQALQSQHFQSQNSQYKNQMYPQQQQQQLVQARSQEILTQRQDEQCYYQNSYGSPQKPAQQRYNLPQNRENYLAIHQQQQQQQQQYETINERYVDDRKAAELRSPQQIERDNMRQKHFEARRAASQPQLAYDEEQTNEFPDHRAQPQSNQTPARRGSHGNIMEVTKSNAENEKDSDDGGFLKRNNSQERRLDSNATTSDNQKLPDKTLQQSEDDKVNSLLSGTPRKRLEGEIGKIEGVYNITQRSKLENDDMRLRKQAGSGASSDYDKNGPSSSNADSGRGSAAYSSGRRPGVDTSNESESQTINNGNYRDTNAQGL